MHTSDEHGGDHLHYEARRRRRAFLTVLAAVATLLAVAGLHVIGILPPGG